MAAGRRARYYAALCRIELGRVRRGREGPDELAAGDDGRARSRPSRGSRWPTSTAAPGELDKAIDELSAARRRRGAGRAARPRADGAGRARSRRRKRLPEARRRLPAAGRRVPAERLCGRGAAARRSTCRAPAADAGLTADMKKRTAWILVAVRRGGGDRAPPRSAPWPSLLRGGGGGGAAPRRDELPRPRPRRARSPRSRRRSSATSSSGGRRRCARWWRASTAPPPTRR